MAAPEYRVRAAGSGPGRLRHVAAQDAPVLIAGESGTGEGPGAGLLPAWRGPRRRSWLSTAPPSPRRFCGDSWPGNIRELQGVLKQALLRATGPVVTVESLPAPVSAPADQPRADGTASVPGGGRPPIEAFLRQQMLMHDGRRPMRGLPDGMVCR